MTTLVRNDGENIGAKRRKPQKTNKVTQLQESETFQALEDGTEEEAPVLSIPPSLVKPSFTPTLGTTTLVQPISASGEQQIYKCPLCQILVNTQKQFTAHIRGHNEVKPHTDPNDPTGQAKVYYCCLCGKMLSSFSSLDRHMLVHSGERPFSCSLCGQTFTTNGNMHRHKRTHVTNRTPAEGGGMENLEAQALTPARRVGRKRKTSEERAKLQQQRLVKSAATKEPNKIFPSPGFNNNSALICMVCKDSFFSEISLESHIAEQHQGMELSCPECDYKAANYGYFKVHLSVFHREYDNTSSFHSGIRQFPHLAKALSLPDDASSKIEEASRPETALSIAKSEESDDSSANIAEKDLFVKDMKLRGEFPCRLCSAVYPNLRALKGHNKEHLNKAPYYCNVGACKYLSHDKNALTRHMRGHTGEKPYECKVCSYGFTTKANCERHLKNKHDKSTRDQIKESIAVHENNRIRISRVSSYRCKVCKTSYPSTIAVVEHALKEHPAYSEDANHIFEEVTIMTPTSSCNNDDEYDEMDEEDEEEDEDEYEVEEEEETNNFDVEGGWNEEAEEKKNSHDSNNEEVSMVPRVSNFPSTIPSEMMLGPLPSLKKAHKLKNNQTREEEATQGADEENDTPLDLSQSKKKRDENEQVKENSSSSSPPPPIIPLPPTTIPLFPPGFPYMIPHQSHPSNLRPTFPFIFPQLGASPAAAAAAAAAAIIGHPSIDTREIREQFFQSEWMKQRLQPFGFANSSICCPNSTAPDIKVPPAPSQQTLREPSPKSPMQCKDEKEAAEALQRLSTSSKKPSTPLIIPKPNETKTISSASSVTTSNFDKDSPDQPVEYKMIIKNGVLMKKQKQRRYRTERPYGCQHCSARFTLRSNMERHIKQQHPNHWSQKPRGSRRSHCTTLQLIDSQYKSDVDENNSSKNDYFSSNINNSNKLIIDEDCGQAEGHEEEPLKCQSPPSVNNNNHISNGLKGMDTKDDGLASVSKLLTTASKKQSFPKFFDSSDELENGTIRGLKCPYCPESVPWTSSSAFRSHLSSTHLGGKCLECQKWFCSRSEFDRHAVQIHSRRIPTSEEEIYNMQFQCPMCDSSSRFSKREDGLLHLQLSHPSEYEAWVERGVFRGALNDGDEEEEDDEEPAVDSFSKRCCLCARGFNSSLDLKKHFIEHLCSLESCRECGRTYTLSSSLKKHGKRHEEESLNNHYASNPEENGTFMSSKFKKRANLMDKINRLSNSIATSKTPCKKEQNINSIFQKPNK